MNEQVEEYILIADLPTDLKLVKSITTKPYVSIIICIVTAVVMIVTQFVAILGWIILAFALLVLWKIPNQKNVDFFEDGLVIYPRRSPGYCQRVTWDEIDEWAVKQGKQNGDMLVMHLTDDRYIYVESFRAASIVRLMNRYVSAKEANRKKNANMKNTPFKWPWKK